MKSMLQRIFKTQLSQIDTSKTLAKAYQESELAHLWEDTGKMFFLEATLKLSFESELGLVCYEKLSIQDALNLLEEIKIGRSPAFRQRRVAGQTTEIRLSICGLSWQSLEGKTRSRAVMDAAILRSTDPNFTKSQAIFKHADRMVELDPSLLTLPNQANVFTYEQITPQQFIDQVKRINERFKPITSASINVNRDNYLSPFSEHEQTVIDEYLLHDKYEKSLSNQEFTDGTEKKMCSATKNNDVQRR